MKYNLILILFVCASCQSQTPDKIDLELIDDGFEIESFYNKKISSTNKILDLKGEDQFAIDTLYVYQNNSSSNENTFQISPKNGLWTSPKEPKKKFGKLYFTDVISPKDSLAFYKNIVFNSIDMVESEKEDFVGLIAKKFYFNNLELQEQELNQLKVELTETHGKFLEHKIRNRSCYSWETKNSLINIILVNNTGSKGDS